MLTYVIPPAWIRNLPGMSSLLQWMFDHLPALNGHVQKSHFPEVAAIYFPLMWLLSPLFFFLDMARVDACGLENEIQCKADSYIFKALACHSFFILLCLWQLSGWRIST